MNKRYAKDFDPSTRVVENCKYMQALGRIAELEAKYEALVEHHAVFDNPADAWENSKAWEHRCKELEQYKIDVLKRLYEALGIDDSDGEYRIKWVMVELHDLIRKHEQLKANNARLREAYYGMMLHGTDLRNGTHAKFLAEAFNETPADSLAAVRRDAKVEMREKIAGELESVGPPEYAQHVRCVPIGDICDD